jgi:hypothetical protein
MFLMNLIIVYIENKKCMHKPIDPFIKKYFWKHYMIHYL